MFRRLLTMLFEVLYHYPTDRPLLYVFRHNGVTAIVRAQDYDAEIRRMRREFQKGTYPGRPGHTWHVRPQIYPIFLFGKKAGPRSFIIADEWHAQCLMEGCAVEVRSFEIPPICAPGHTPLGYHGWLMEEVGRENSRLRSYTYEEAVDYLRRGKPVDPELLALPEREGM